jgi:hypothetical protein
VPALELCCRDPNGADRAGSGVSNRVFDQCRVQEEGGGFALLPTAAPINIPLSKRTEENYKAMIDAGKSLSEMARELGITVQSVHKFITLRGWKTAYMQEKEAGEKRAEKRRKIIPQNSHFFVYSGRKSRQTPNANLTII